jgi:hypothetical protein
MTITCYASQVQLLEAFVQGELVFIKDNFRDTDEAAFLLSGTRYSHEGGKSHLSTKKAG